MSKPEYLDRLLDLASTTAGSDYALAKLLDVNRATVSQWRSGKRSCPVGDVVLMAQIAGLNSEEWAARAVVSQYEGTPKGEKLYKALGKLLLATGGAIATSGVNAAQIFTPKLETAFSVVSQFIRCIVLLSYRQDNDNRELIA